MGALCRYDLAVADLKLWFASDHGIRRKDRFRPFLTDHDRPDLTIRFARTGRLPDIRPRTLHEDVCCRVHPNGRGGTLRSFFDAPGDLTPCAPARREGERLGSVSVFGSAWTADETAVRFPEQTLREEGIL